MNNECKSKHPDKAWFCEDEAFHRGNHFIYSGWGSNMKKHEWPKGESSSNGKETDRLRV